MPSLKIKPNIPKAQIALRPSKSLRVNGMINKANVGVVIGNHIADIAEWEDRFPGQVTRTLLHLGLRVYARLLELQANGEMPVGKGLGIGARVWMSDPVVGDAVVDDVVAEVVSE